MRELKIRQLVDILIDEINTNPNTTLGDVFDKLKINIGEQVSLLALMRIDLTTFPVKPYDPTGMNRGHQYGKITDDNGKYVTSNEPWCKIKGCGW